MMKISNFKLRYLLTLAVVLFCSLGTDVRAQAPAQVQGYDAFRGLKTRNIFDPDRRGPRVESTQSTAPSNRPDHLALTGTMVTNGKTLAFFAGSRSEFNKVISVRDKIGDYTVSKITSTQVDLERDGKPVTLDVGKQLALDGSGSISANTGASFSSSSSSSNSVNSSLTPPAGVPADKAEILRRMMERRQQENSK